MKIFFLLIGFILFPLFANSQPFIFVFLNNRSDKSELPKAEVEKIMEGHMANIKRLASEGKLIAAGPFEGGGGMFIFKASSVDQAKEWLGTDPGVQAKRWNIEMFPYTPRVGGVCSVGEPYQMVNYEFVRFTVKYTKYNIKDAAESAKKHDDFAKKLGQNPDVVTEGTFGEEGGILVMRGDLQKDLIESDPGIAEGLYEVDYKTLFIAKGAFCEPRP